MVSLLPGVLLTITTLISDRQKIHDELASRSEWLNSYDYIVVGAGSSGSVVAARLSEDPNVTVLLLEAGEQQWVDYDFPTLHIYPVDESLLWSYKFVPQNNSCLLSSPCGVVTGKVLGGGSSVNAMVYIRGNRNDFDGWANKYGAKGWSYEEVLPYFLKSENNTDKELVAQNPRYHSTGGPLGVSSHKNPDPIFSKYLEAANKLGYPTVDINGEKQFGAMISQSAIGWDGIRSSTANVFLQPNRNRKNLHILASAFVTQILFNNTTANGVKFVKNEKNFTVNAKKEVIISAGTIRSAMLLMLSGIGPKEHLSKMNIPVIADLPVGNNYHDHLSVWMGYLIKNQCDVKSKEPTIQNINNFFFNKNNSTLALIDIMNIFLNAGTNPNKDWPSGLIQSRPFYDDYLCKYMLGTTIMLNRPKSRGTIRLSSNNPFDLPLIDPNILSDETDDLQTMIEIVREATRIHDSSKFFQYIEKYYLPVEGCKPCNNNTYDCDEYLTCFIRGYAGSSNHPVGSCRMGSTTDTNAVVDERLRVRKVSRLRVIDTSIIPQITSGNVYAPSVMIGERGAQFIKEDNK